MTTSALTSTKTGSPSLIEKYTLPIFFGLVLALTWPFLIVDALGSHGILPFRLQSPPIMIVEAYMPTLAAVIMTGIISGRKGIRTLFKKLLIARVGFHWYAFAIFALSAVCISAIALANRFGPPPALPILSQDIPASGPAGILVTSLLIFLISLIFNGEELAWRGFALPRLQARYNALTASLILSVPWFLFHLPLFFTKGSSQEHMSLSCYAIQLAATTILFTWLYNHTRGSVLLACLFHASMNTWTQIFSMDPANQFQGWVFTGLIVALAVIVTVVYGSENLSRTLKRIQE